MIAQPLDPPLQPITEGHTFGGIKDISRRDTPEGGDPAPPASPLARVEMVFAPGTGCTGRKKVMISSDGDSPGITIDSPENWEFSVAAQILPLGPGRWNWLISTEDSNTPPVRDPLLSGSLEIKSAP